ncbi:MAG: DUF1697 domain-containing protein [Steroidobacteraceae bacterium]
MPRYVAFLRGVSPMNARMADLREFFVALGFTDVRTVLSSGNVIFTGASKAEATLARAIESGMGKHLQRSFPTMVRRIDHLAALLAEDPYSKFHFPPKAKRVVTFLGEPCRGKISLPIELDGARILTIKGGEVFTVYEPNERGPVFMTLIEKTFGKNVTTRTLDTVKKCVAA